MERLTIGRLCSGGVITNYDCVSRCGHCLYNCGPHREKDYLAAAAAERIFARIAELGCRAVHIGGGEPLLAPEKLIEVLRAAGRCGVSIDYVETNSAWFKDPDRADHMLKRLQEAGAHTLLISISPFHIDLYGGYVPGLCSGLAVAMEDLGRPLDPEKYPLVHRLFTAGIKGLLGLAIERHGYAPRRDAFLSACDLCTDIRSFLFADETAAYSELAPEGFYAELARE